MKAATTIILGLIPLVSLVNGAAIPQAEMDESETTYSRTLLCQTLGADVFLLCSNYGC